MTDETMIPPQEGDNETVTPPAAPDWSLYAPDTGDLDIDAALAAVASLSDPVTPQEAEEIAIDAAPRKRVGAYTPTLALPPLSRLKRGQLGSVVPALLLIGVGAWLTLTTTSGGAVDSMLLTLLLIGGAALALIAYWIGSGRWSHGTLLFGALIALTLVVIVTAGRVPAISYPALLIAAGIAVILAGALSRPPLRRAAAPALLLIAAGLIGVVTLLVGIPSALLPALNIAAPAAAVVVLIVLLLPRLRRR
jgi:hypothetical protein